MVGWWCSARFTSGARYWFLLGAAATPSRPHTAALAAADYEQYCFGDDAAWLEVGRAACGAMRRDCCVLAARFHSTTRPYSTHDLDTPVLAKQMLRLPATTFGE